ncbi:MAG: phosphopyruvate hydratase [Clostridiaceae bacterium]|nr:phosphopyruvate hydratase [Clostridiaceae bacterium]
MNRNSIAKLKARQVLDSKGRPVIEVDVITEGGMVGRAGASTGTSVGKNESFVLRDNNPNCFNGLSVYKAIENVEKKIAPALIGMDATNIESVDRRMIDLDGTHYKSNLGGNAIYACSVAAARAGAACKGIPLYQFLATDEIKTIYTPAYNMINGGKYGEIMLAFQEFIVIPKGVSTVTEGYRIGVEIFMRLGEIIKKYQGGKPAVMGNYSGYGAPTDDPFELFDMLKYTAASLGYQDKYCFAMDCAASEIYDEEKNAYMYRGRYSSREELISLLAKLTERYHIGFIEDALQEEDFEGFKIANQSIKCNIIGDDFLCSSIDRAKKAIEIGAAAGMILKPNQVGTITEALETVKFMKENNMLVVASGRAGGVLDDPNAELAIAVGAPLMKTGAPRSGERTLFTNTALRIEEELEGKARMYDVTTIPGFCRKTAND